MFALRMAWRDYRAKPSRFVLYIAAVAVGVGALTAIESYRRELAAAIHDQGRQLLGADLVLKSRRPFDATQEALVSEWPGRKAHMVSYRTMLLDVERGVSRLVEVQAFDDGFPFYGDLATHPLEAADRFKREGSILVDEVLLMQVERAPGDEVDLGGQRLRIAGALRQTPGDVPARSLLAPRVMLPLRVVSQERLQSPGMAARHEWYLAFSEGELPPQSVATFAARAQAAGLGVDTIEQRRNALLGETDRFVRYLGLMGFTSLLIGSLGVAGAVQFFVNAKRMTVAQLRCMGASVDQATGFFVVELSMLALVGTTLGVGVGALLGPVVQVLLEPFMPVMVSRQIRWDAAGVAWLAGLYFTLLAGLFPVTRLRRISPLLSMRISGVQQHRGLDVSSWLTLALWVGGLLYFATSQLGRVQSAALYLGGMALVMVLLAGTGLLLRWVARLLVRPGWPYTWRLAMSALYRPQNQTALLLVSLGLGVFFIHAVDLMERHVLQDFETLDRKRPNLAMIDIQVDQRDDILERLAKYAPTSVYVEPMITMRLAALNDTPVEKLEQEPGKKRERWALRREFRATYRSEIKADIEKVVAGTWVGSVALNERPVPISLEEGIAEALHVGVGDRLLFDLHGEFIETRVANLREADWKSMQPNFFVVFPEGVIEDAPQSMLLFTELEDLKARAAFQVEVARQFPNITAIDISLMMNAVGKMVGQLTTAVRVLAWMTMMAGFLVLLAILRAGRNERMREAVLLRTLGASTGVIIRYQLGELLLLTLAAMLSGLLLSWVAAGLVITYVMKLPYAPGGMDVWPYLVGLLLMIGLTGWHHARAATRKGPAATWRDSTISSA